MSEKQYRKAERKDASLILKFIQAIAAYEKMSDQVINTPEKIEEVLFDQKKAEVIFAMNQGKEVGFALFFENYSTFTGSTGIYLEDLFVYPEYRAHGYGKGLFLELVRIARDRGCQRMEWVCLNWNTPSVRFYHSLGARGMTDWTTFRLDRKGIDLLCGNMDGDLQRAAGVLESERLVLRPWTIEDANRLYALASDPEIGYLTGWKPHQSVEHSREILKAVLMKPDEYAIEEKLTGDIIGSCGIHKTEFENRLEPGIWLGREYWRKHYGKEVIQTLLKEIFTRKGIDEASYSFFSENKASAALCFSLGFHYDQLKRDVMIHPLQETRDVIECLIRKDQLEKSLK